MSVRQADQKEEVMRKGLLLGLVLIGCLAVVGAAMARNDNNRNFFAHLSGDEEIPSRETRAVETVDLGNVG